jgi:hypothetical protein
MMDKPQQTGRNLGRVYNLRNVCLHAMRLLSYGVKLPNLKLKPRPKQLLGSLSLDMALPILIKEKEGRLNHWASMEQVKNE